MMFRFPGTFRTASRQRPNFRSVLLSCLSILANGKSTIADPAPLRYPVDEEEAARSGSAWEMKFSELPLRALGLWPMDDRFANVKYLLCLTTMTTYWIPSVIRVFFTGSDDPLDRPLGIVTENTPLLYAIIQFVMFKCKSRSVKILLTRIHRDWGESVNLSEVERTPMFRYGGKTRKVTVLLIGFFFMCCMGENFNLMEYLVISLLGNSTIKQSNIH